VRLGSGAIQAVVAQQPVSSPAPASKRTPAAEPATALVDPEQLARELADARERASHIPPPEAPLGQRMTGDELIADLFDSLGDLHYLSDALDGASFVLALALEKLPSDVGLVSLFDINKRTFVVVCQTGGGKSVLLQTIAEAAELPRRAMRSSSAVVAEDPATMTASDPRWADIGVPLQSLVCAPVEAGGRYLGLIELANPRDGVAFNESDGHALTYIGRQFAEFLNERGLSIDPEAVVARARAR
jgi:hypothetical protein